MKIKQRPEDFSVKESWRFDTVEGGPFRVYLMDKQKLSTFEAVDRIRVRFGLRPGLISFCGLKDKQGRTEQLIAVEGVDVDLQDPDLRLKFLGRTDRPLSAENTTSNRFSVTVRQLTGEDLNQLPLSAAEVNRLGVVNYFDSQRFGGLKHGQGFIAKDLVRGDFEAALFNYMARPSPLDRTADAKVKKFWAEHWGTWTKKSPEASTKFYRILQSLKEKPRDVLRAFLQIEASYRAMLLFEYQSYLWNEGVRRLLANLLPREALFPMPYQAGTLLFHKDAPGELLRELRHLTFPLLAHDSKIEDARIQAAVDWVLGKEKIQLSDLQIPEAKRLLFFKHEERPLIVYPQKLVLGKPSHDELNPGFKKINVAFTLPPGSYATLTIKRLFHFSWLEDVHLTRVEAEAKEAAEGRTHRRFVNGRPVEEKPAPEERPRRREREREREPQRERPQDIAPEPSSRLARLGAKERPSEGVTGGPAEGKSAEKPLGFRDAQRQKKAAREANRLKSGNKPGKKGR